MRGNGLRVVPRRLAAVVTPVVRFPVTPDEEISLRHLRERLGDFDRYIIGPQRLPAELKDFKLRKFPARHFRDVYGYNRLLMTAEFYRAFADYQYILIYQLDCLVFASNLEEWCAKGWDYAGAPWVKQLPDGTKEFGAVGNGGLSLRRVAKMLEVLASKRLADDPETRAAESGYWEFLYANSDSGAAKVARNLKRTLHQRGYHNNVRWLTRKMAGERYHEDYFWAFHAPKFVKEFRVPEPCEAAGFSFEMEPRYCFEMTGGHLPFGCHAWTKYDREFWAPYLLR